MSTSLLSFTSARRPRQHARRPRASPTRPPEAFVPAPVLLAVATASLTMAYLRYLRSLHQDPIKAHRIVSRRLQRLLVSKLPVFQSQTPRQSQIPVQEQDTIQARLDFMRDKAVAQLETEKVMAAPQRISNEQYATLTSAQRREMLASAFSYVNKSGVPGATLAQLSAVTSDISTKSARRSAQARAKGTRKPFGVSNVKAQKEETRVTAFLRAAESVSGRAASLGFVLCLAREIVEPGHPGLFEQVVDVVVPIAQKTPPFLVAVADRLVDLLT